ncbi:MAG: hypothetical protein GY928_28065 [Colwellia sp.]|nr:hypothetical protein [Colwellia sp.]
MLNSHPEIKNLITHDKPKQ